MKEVYRIVIYKCDSAPLEPGRVTLAEKRQVSMTTFGIKFGFPPIAADSLGVTQRELSVTVNNGTPDKKDYPADVILSNEYTFTLDDEVVAQVVDKDQSGNPSPPSAPFSFTVTDDVPPSVPGAPTQAEKRQIS